MLEGDDGQPLGMINMGVLIDAGCSLAFKIAAHCGDPDAVQAILTEVLSEHGTDSFGYIATNALVTLAGEVLDPALTAGEAAGVNLRDGLLALSEGRDPLAGQVSG